MHIIQYGYILTTNTKCMQDTYNEKLKIIVERKNNYNNNYASKTCMMTNY